MREFHSHRFGKLGTGLTLPLTGEGIIKKPRLSRCEVGILLPFVVSALYMECSRRRGP